jgi:hypothetical protein
VRVVIAIVLLWNRTLLLKAPPPFESVCQSFLGGAAVVAFGDLLVGPNTKVGEWLIRRNCGTKRWSCLSLGHLEAMPCYKKWSGPGAASHALTVEAFPASAAVDRRTISEMRILLLAAE